MRALSWAAAPIALFMSGVAAAAPAVGQAISFVACPIARDTGPDTDLCFLTEYDGVLYGITNPPDIGNPQLRHKVLFEGKIAAGPPACGGLRVDGRASVLPEVEVSCDRILPFDGVIVGVAGGVFNSGPPEQRARMAALAERAKTEPALSIQPVMPDPPAPTPPVPPFETRTLTIYYPFDSDRGSGPDMLEVTRLVAYAAASKANIKLVSRQGVTLLQSGERMAERPGMAKQRADKLAGIFTGLGTPAASVTTEVIAGVATPDGDEDWKERRIEVTVTPK